MQRETKLNLVFLVGFLLLALPGVVIMFVKKLDPDERQMFAPPYVRPTAAYNNPNPTRSDTVRVTPPRTGQWVSELSLAELHAPPQQPQAAGGRPVPVMSEQRYLELLNIAERPGETRVVLLAWLEEFGQEQVRTVEGRLLGENGEALAVDRVEIEPLAVPEAVVAELKEEGYVLPPGRVALLWLRAPPLEGMAPRRLELTWATATDRRRDAMELPGTLPPAAGGGKEGFAETEESGDGH